MLVNAKLYEQELQEIDRQYWYDLKYQFVNAAPWTKELTLEDGNAGCHVFVSIDPDTGEIIGAMGYEPDWIAKSVQGFFAPSYVEGGSPIFAKDLLQMIDDIFEKYHFNRMDWHCWADNPAIRGYRKFCKRYGGREVGVLRRKGRLLDGYLHDSVIFELLSEDYLAAKQMRAARRGEQND